jgi:hypothetical protein
VFSLNAEYHNRLKQDALFKSRFPGKSSFAMSSEFTWLPIQFLTGRCTDKKDVEMEEMTEAERNSCFSAKNISLELRAKGWWFPKENNLTGGKVRRLEGRAEVSLLIPVGNIADQFLFKKSKGNFTSRIRLKYVTGANDASGFKRSSAFTYGIELIK